ncbi:30S ribosomal protein S20 [Oceanotoga sp. DSM 15011]|jgi:small subunit ribosomal protein S20|uniref:Small ribosomal subunit protein bS20 n=1 Tax=Oceanotoga teriensis TaxID=515440 RepID=A0AA45C5C9_9BACT|nr:MULTISPECIES: 30S ribosomal protein S20 [Oceanotoga]MDN5342295.1 small subunit ribosomal protein [Oceanotoga sp.]MDO7977358.1 30S ribosomal protein S20 [Oceanotoga teriensis]PWJ88748.1 SSU ribosomal protein S20P [Oceanotoga teriensis]UYP00425.1 30S ribosomal protein S20 [Oceanotoga sp. DSM 15011]
MPNIKSAKKRVLQSEKRRVINKSYKTRIKNTTKTVLTNIKLNKNREELLESLSVAFKAIDKAESKGVIHKNTAARKKSRLHIKVKKFLGEVAPE